MAEKFYYLGQKRRTSKKSENVYNIAYVIIEDNYRFSLKEVIVSDEVSQALEDLKPDLNDIQKYLSLRYNSYTNNFELNLNIN